MSCPGQFSTCALCGQRYITAKSAACHAGCPMQTHCRLLRCPHCGYEIPAPTRLTRWLERWLRRDRELDDAN